MNSSEKLEIIREYAKNVLVASFIKETQVGRSIGSSKRDGKQISLKQEFNKELLNSIIKLRKLVDSKTIKNINIRNEIQSLSERTGVTIGQSQKVINVYLKYYCLILNKPLKIISELDCPLDSTTMENKEKMKDIVSIERYNMWQGKFELDFGIRLFRDEEYDLNRLRNTFYRNKENTIPILKPEIKRPIPGISLAPLRITKKSVCLEFLNKENGGSIEEMAKAIVDRGIDPDYEKNKRVCRLWMSKIGIPVKKLPNGRFIKGK